MKKHGRRVLVLVALLAGLSLGGCTPMGSYKWQVQRDRISKDIDRYVGMGPEWP